MEEIQRYALYLVPSGPLGAFGTQWLGWDMDHGTAIGKPHDAPLDWSEITAEPRRYGFHATIKPPFRLADGCAPADLKNALREYCRSIAAFSCLGLRLSSIDGFMALVPEGDTLRLDAFAADVVERFDPFRRPAPPEEIARRRASGLTDRQDANLMRWGYPYVMEDFRAHFTLTGRLSSGRATELAADLSGRLATVPLRPFAVDSLCLVGEQITGGFRLLHRYALSGEKAG